MLEMAGDVAFLRINSLMMYTADEAGVGPLGAAAGYFSMRVTGALDYHCHRVCTVGVQVVGVVVYVVCEFLLILGVEFILLIPIDGTLAHPEVI